jgi:hypothetical protein
MEWVGLPGKGAPKIQRLPRLIKDTVKDPDRRKTPDCICDLGVPSAETCICGVLACFRKNLEPKRGRFAAPFEFENWDPQKNGCGNGLGPRKLAG